MQILIPYCNFEFILNSKCPLLAESNKVWLSIYIFNKKKTTTFSHWKLALDKLISYVTLFLRLNYISKMAVFFTKCFRILSDWNSYNFAVIVNLSKVIIDYFYHTSVMNLVYFFPNVVENQEKSLIKDYFLREPY